MQRQQSKLRTYKDNTKSVVQDNDNCDTCKNERKHREAGVYDVQG